MIKKENKSIKITLDPITMQTLDKLCSIYNQSYSKLIRDSILQVAKKGKLNLTILFREPINKEEIPQEDIEKAIKIANANLWE